MTPVLQIVLCLAVTVLTVFLVRLLIQARRTAAAVERFTDSATSDLRQVAEDIHAARARVDDVTALFKDTLEPSSPLTQVVTGVVRAIPAFFPHRSHPTDFLETLVTGIETALHLFRTRKANPPKEESHE